MTMLSLLPLLTLVTLPLDLDAITYTGWDPKLLAIADGAPYFLSRDELGALSVAPPPANSDARTRTELDELLRLERARTPAQKRAILAHLGYDGTCAAILGTIHRELDHAPKTRALLRHVERDASIAVFSAKKRFARARPTQLEPRLRPAIAVPRHAAYPSGHAILGHTAALVLAEIFPDYRAQLLTQGDEIGHEREIAGVHYASDSEAGRALGDQLLARLKTNERFTRELAAAKAEWPCQGP